MKSSEPKFHSQEVNYLLFLVVYGTFMQLVLFSCPTCLWQCWTVVAVARHVALCWLSCAAGSFGFCVSMPDALILKAFKNFVRFVAIVPCPGTGPDPNRNKLKPPSRRYTAIFAELARSKEVAVAPFWWAALTGFVISVLLLLLLFLFLFLLLLPGA